MWPEMPPGVEDRHADRWEALISVADLAGGHWPDTARVAAVTDVTDSKAGTPSIGVMLLRDIKTVFEKHQVDRIATDTVLNGPEGDERESPWAVIRRGEPLNARGLASGSASTASRRMCNASATRSPGATRVRSSQTPGLGTSSTESVTSVTTVTTATPEPGDPACGCGNRLKGP